MIVEIKQAAIDNPNQDKYKTSYGEYTMFPKSSRVYRLQKARNGKYVTGLSEEEAFELGQLIGKNLDPLSSFWRDYSLKFQMPAGSMKKNDEIPEDKIFLAVAQANKLLAPDKETLKSDFSYKQKGIIFYINDVEKQEKAKSRLIQIKDEIASIMHKMSNNKERMFYIILKLGRSASLALKEEKLYNMLAEYREGLTKVEKLIDFKNILETPNEELQAYYFVNEGLKEGLIRMDVENEKYKFADKFLGKTKEDVYKFFSEKKNVELFISLMNEIKSK